MCALSQSEGLGYVYRGEHGIPRRHFFVKGEPRTFHIHMFEIESEEWINHLLFRDHLIQHLEDTLAYARVKRELAEKFRNDRERYTDGKAPFIQSILSKAKKAL